MMLRFATPMAAAGLAAALMSGSALADGLTLTGEIFYLERIALPGNAVASVQLVDISRADAPARVVSRQVIDPAGQVPIGFALPFDPADIAAGHRYAVEARIEADGRLRFVNDTQVAVEPLTGTGPLRIRLVAASEEGGAPATDPGAGPLLDTHWRLTELDGRPAAPGVETTLAFRADGFGGRGGCNSYGGMAAFEGEDGLAVSQVVSTMMACPGPMMDQEQAYFRALDAVVSYDLDGETLTLLDAGGAALAVFTATAPADS